MQLFRQNKTILLKTVIHCLCLSICSYMYWMAIGDNLGSDPVKEIIHFTGMSTLNVLLLTLLVSPTAKLLKQPWLMQVRRLLGLYAFFFALLHVLNFLFFELQFDFSLFVDEIIDRPYITLGMAAFVIITLLAITSLNSIKRRMGKSWQTLHNYVYLLVLLVCIHFYWSVKSDITEPVIYFLLLFMLLYHRKTKFKRWLKR